MELPSAYRATGIWRRPSAWPTTPVSGWANIFATDYRTAYFTARKLNAGSVWVNMPNGSQMNCPFGGDKNSGLDGLKEYLRIKNTCGTCVPGFSVIAIDGPGHVRIILQPRSPAAQPQGSFFAHAVGRPPSLWAKFP